MTKKYVLISGGVLLAYLIYINYINVNAGNPGTGLGIDAGVDFGVLNPSTW